MKRFIISLLLLATFLAPTTTTVFAIPFVKSDIQSPTVDYRVDALSDLLSISTDKAILSVSSSGFLDGTTVGGGVFIWDALLNKNLANGGTIIDPSSSGGFDGTLASLSAYLSAQGGGVGTGCWVREYSGGVDVRWFGAVGNGINNDAPAVQAASDYINSLNGGILYLDPSLTSILDATVELFSNTIVTGGGRLKHAADTTAFALLVSDAADNVVIDGIVLDGNVANQTTWSESRHSLIMYGTTHSRVTNCTFVGTIGDGLYVSHNGDFVWGNGLQINGNKFIGTNVNRNGVSIIAGENIDITNNFFLNMTSANMPAAVDIEPNNATEVVSRVTISNNIFYSTLVAGTQKAVAVNNNSGAAVSRILISDNVIEGKYRYGIAVFGDAVDRTLTETDVFNNRVTNTQYIASISAGIIASSEVIVNIIGNMVDGASAYGIKTVGATYVIDENTIKNATDYGIEAIAAADTGTIKNNTIIDCGTDAAASFGGIHNKAGKIQIIGNHITSSATTLSQTGLYIETGIQCIIDGNVFEGMGVRAMSLTLGPHMIGQNKYSAGFNSLGGNYPPSVAGDGDWLLGDIIYDATPSASGFIGWVCTASGAPGTWKTFGAIAP